MRNKIHCHYLMALGYYGLGNVAKSEKELKTVIEMNHVHQGAKAFESFTEMK